MFTQSGWKAYFKSSATDVLVCEGKRLPLLTEETDTNISRHLSFSISLLPPPSKPSSCLQMERGRLLPLTPILLTAGLKRRIY